MGNKGGNDSLPPLAVDVCIEAATAFAATIHIHEERGIAEASQRGDARLCHYDDLVNAVAGVHRDDERQEFRSLKHHTPPFTHTRQAPKRAKHWQTTSQEHLATA